MPTAFQTKPQLKPQLWQLLLCTSLVFAWPVSAQEATDTGGVESDSAAEAGTAQAPRLSVVYVDIPFVFAEGVDPVLPELDSARGDSLEPDELTARSINEYDLTLETIEDDGGVWDPQLIEQLTAQGSLQQQQGDHATAIATFDRAMHVNRINNGLHTTEQIPIVEELIESYMALEDWANVDLYYNYLFYVQQKAYGSEDPRMIPVLAQLGQWHLQAFNIGFGEMLGLHLSSAQILFDAAVQMVNLHFGPQDERLVTYLRSIADSAYLVASNPEIMSEVNRPDFRTSQDLLMAQLNQRNVDMTPAGFSAGEAALQQVVAVQEELADDPYVIAEAYANLGDWYLLFRQRRVAEEQYLTAWNLLAAEENAEELQQRLFGQVTPIPTFITEPRLLYRGGSVPSGPEELTEEFVDLSFIVTRNGEVRRVTVLGEETADEAGLVARVVREMRRFAFRPQVQEGVALETEDNRARVRFWY